MLQLRSEGPLRDQMATETLHKKVTGRELGELVIPKVVK